MRVPVRLLKWFYSRLDAKVPRHYVVFESDDWGAIRMHSPEVLEQVERMGFGAKSNVYEANDCLETEVDIRALNELLSEYTDELGHNPVFTLNYAMANPDFKAIEESGFTQYSYQVFTQTFSERYGKEYPLDIVGMNKRLFPQFHCREHYNVAKWMSALLQDSFNMRSLAQLGLVGTHIPSMGGNEFVKSFDAETIEENETIKNAIDDGLNLFYQVFGYKSASTIAPNYLWDTSLNDAFLSTGVKYLQGGRFQRLPNFREKANVPHYIGEKRDGLVHTVRNCIFEPSTQPNALERCLHDIEKAFANNRSAIICSHRVNYMSSINPQNGENGRRQLRLLLSAIIKRWPDVKFINSVQLGDILNGKKDSDI